MRERRPKRLKIKKEDIPAELKKENAEGEVRTEIRSLKSENDSPKSKRISKGSFAAGIIIIIFALAGLAFSVYYAVGFINDKFIKKDYSQYNDFVIPVAAIDPETFDDISGADMNDLLNIALWSLVDSDTAPDTYKYDDGYMLIPDSDVESAFTKFFSNEIKPEHKTVEGYGYEFTYDKTNKVYKIPLTAITPIYTPSITEVKQERSSVVITVGMISYDSWETDENGNMITPGADKYLKITLLERSGNYYISAIQSASSTPDTVNAPLNEAFTK